MNELKFLHGKSAICRHFSFKYIRASIIICLFALHCIALFSFVCHLFAIPSVSVSMCQLILKCINQWLHQTPLKCFTIPQMACVNLPWRFILLNFEINHFLERVTINILVLHSVFCAAVFSSSIRGIWDSFLRLSHYIRLGLWYASQGAACAKTSSLISQLINYLLHWPFKIDANSFGMYILSKWQRKKYTRTRTPGWTK